ncbi:CHAT domain-containing protein [Streptomyces sp. NPDC050564]|uniref:CHAT domain-containing protein n=1 Tax=Streptomyces sp. NPDC050564 TaxID=3365631 RepID=UPI003793E409
MDDGVADRASRLLQHGAELIGRDALIEAEIALRKAADLFPVDDLRRSTCLEKLGKIRVARGKLEQAAASFRSSFIVVAANAYREYTGSLEVRRIAASCLGEAVGLSVSLALMASNPKITASAMRQVMTWKAITAALTKVEPPRAGPLFPRLSETWSRLPADGVLLEFLRYAPHDFTAPLECAGQLPDRYACFALGGWADDRRVTLIDVGLAKEIDDCVADVREEMSGLASYHGGCVSMPVAEMRRLFEAEDDGSDGPPVTAQMQVTYSRSHQLIEHTVTIDAVSFRQLMWDLSNGTSTFPQEQLHRLYGLQASAGKTENPDPPHPPEPPSNVRGRASRALAAAVLEPLRPLVSRARRVIIAPDSELWLAPFAALPNTDGSPWLTDATLTFVNHGLEPTTDDSLAVGAGDPLVVADPAFGAPDGKRKRTVFAPLPHALEEGKIVASLLGVAVTTGLDATDMLLRNVRSPRVLHLATHAFAVRHQEVPSRGLPNVNHVGRFRGFELLTHSDKPWHRCGVALANAALWESTGESLPKPGDGLLLGSDIAGLSLKDTALVVLSACETGLGEVGAGDVPWSAGHAFRQAGARVVVMSLWRVPDGTTRTVIQEFYRRLAAGASPAHALQQAQRKAWSEGLHPRHWAAFVCLGVPAHTLRPFALVPSQHRHCRGVARRRRGFRGPRG